MYQKGAIGNRVGGVISVLIIALGLAYYAFRQEDTFLPYTISTDNTLTTNIDGYFETCMDSARIYKLLYEGEWVQLLNGLEGKGNYYLDDEFVGYGMCDVVQCQELPKPYNLRLIEYNKVGEKDTPVGHWSGVNMKNVPVYESAPITGDIKVEIPYATDPNCQNKTTASIVLKR